MAELSVSLSAKVRKFLKSIDDVEKALERVEDQAEDTQAATAIVGSRSAKSFKTVQKGAANATPTLLEFNRVIQDAPFGIQGVANNITQLVQNFGTLQQQSGGAVAALKSVGAAFLGPAGLVFAVSAVTSLLVQFGGELGKSKDKAKELEDQLKKINDQFSSELALNRELTKNLELQDASTDEIKRQRVEILNRQLQSVRAVLAQNEALLTQVRIQNEIVSDWELITQAVTKLAAGAVVLLTAAYQTSKQVLDSLREPLENLLDIEIDRSSFSAATADELAKQQELTNQNNSLKAQLLGITNDILEAEKGITKEVEKRTTPQTATVGGAITTQGPASGIGPSAEVLTTKIANELDLQQTLWRSYAENIRDIADNQIVPSLVNLGQNIGSALAQGGNILQAIGSSILQAFGQFLSQFGQQLILYGKAALAFSTVSKALTNPITAAPAAGAAIALGALLTVAGGVLSGIASGGLSFGGGGGNSSGGGGSFSGGATANFSGGSSVSGLEDVVFILRGQDLVGSISRTLTRNQRIGNNIVLG